VDSVDDPSDLRFPIDGFEDATGSRGSDDVVGDSLNLHFGAGKAGEIAGDVEFYGGGHGLKELNAGVSVDFRVGSEEVEVVSDCLADELSVKWIAVDLREGVEKQGSGFIRRKLCETMLRAEFWDVGLRIFGQLDFSYAEFDRDLSCRDRAEKHSVAGVLNKTSPFERQLVVPGPKPESITRIN